MHACMLSGMGSLTAVNSQHADYTCCTVCTAELPGAEAGGGAAALNSKSASMLLRAPACQERRLTCRLLLRPEM